MRYCLSSVRLFSGSACGRACALPAPSRSANAQPARRFSHAPVIRLRNRFDRGYRLPGTCFAALLRAAMQNQFCLPCRGSASRTAHGHSRAGPVCVCRALPTNLKYTCLPVLREDIAAPSPFGAGFSGSGQFFAVFSGFRAVSLRYLPVFTGFQAVLVGLTRCFFGFLCVFIGFLPQKAKSPAANTPLPWSFFPEYIPFS